MKTKSQAKKVQRQIDSYRKEYQRVRARLQKVGFIFRGSITRRYIPCGNQNCRCRNRKHWHGPYYQISWKQKGKTVSRFLPAKTVIVYREWLANDRTLRSILNEMKRVSRKAADAIQAAEATRGKARKIRIGSGKVA